MYVNGFHQTYENGFVVEMNTSESLSNSRNEIAVSFNNDKTT